MKAIFERLNIVGLVLATIIFIFYFGITLFFAGNDDGRFVFLGLYTAFYIFYLLTAATIRYISTGIFHLRDTSNGRDKHNT